MKKLIKKGAVPKNTYRLYFTNPKLEIFKEN